MYFHTSNGETVPAISKGQQEWPKRPNESEERVCIRADFPEGTRTAFVAPKNLDLQEEQDKNSFSYRQRR